jgi:hypothetical protein
LNSGRAHSPPAGGGTTTFAKQEHVSQESKVKGQIVEWLVSILSINYARAKRATVVAALVEDNSLRAIARITGAARMTVEKLLRDLGAACAAHHDATVRGLKSQRIQCNEIWAFVGSKQRNVPKEKEGQWGDCWTWTALDPDSKLIVSYRVGQRTQAVAYDFMLDLPGVSTTVFN